MRNYFREIDLFIWQVIPYIRTDANIKIDAAKRDMRALFTRDVTGTRNWNRNPILPGIFWNRNRYTLFWMISQSFHSFTEQRFYPPRVGKKNRQPVESVSKRRLWAHQFYQAYGPTFIYCMLFQGDRFPKVLYQKIPPTDLSSGYIPEPRNLCFLKSKQRLIIIINSTNFCKSLLNSRSSSIAKNK